MQLACPRGVVTGLVRFLLGVFLVSDGILVASDLKAAFASSPAPPAVLSLPPRISEKTVHIIGGILFLLFGIGALFE